MSKYKNMYIYVYKGKHNKILVKKLLKLKYIPYYDTTFHINNALIIDVKNKIFDISRHVLVFDISRHVLEKTHSFSYIYRKL